MENKDQFSPVVIAGIEKELRLKRVRQDRYYAWALVGLWLLIYLAVQFGLLK